MLLCPRRVWFPHHVRAIHGLDLPTDSKPPTPSFWCVERTLRASTPYDLAVPSPVTPIDVWVAWLCLKPRHPVGCGSRTDQRKANHKLTLPCPTQVSVKKNDVDFPQKGGAHGAPYGPRHDTIWLWPYRYCPTTCYRFPVSTPGGPTKHKIGPFS